MHSTGVCGACVGGVLKKTTFGIAWANRGMVKGLPSCKNEDCYQCNQCDMIYHVTHVEASDISLRNTKANRKDFGFSHGRA